MKIINNSWISKGEATFLYFYLREVNFESLYNYVKIVRGTNYMPFNQFEAVAKSRFFFQVSFVNYLIGVILILFFLVLRSHII